MKNYLMLACTILKDELLAAAAHSDVRFPILFIPPDLHLFPDKLREYLQRTLDDLENVDVVLLPMGRCGNGTIGLRSERATIVLPKCEDCVNLLLSGDDLCVERPGYSFFLTEGWLRTENSMPQEYLRALDKYGEETATAIMKMMYANYKYFVFIDTGTYALPAAMAQVRELASIVDVELTTAAGPCGVLDKMMRLELDGNFTVIPPGTPVSEAHFQSEPS